LSELDPEMITIALAVIQRRAGVFDPSTFLDPSEAALRRLVEAKLKRRADRAEPAPEPQPVADLTSALKRSLAEEGPRVWYEPAVLTPRSQ
jgi:DNA end-binding protein Ku